MRKISYLLLGAVLGGGITSLGLNGLTLGSIGANAAGSDIYRQLNLFGDVFEKIRTDYVEKPDAFGPEWLVSFNITPVVPNIIDQWVKGL